MATDRFMLSTIDNPFNPFTHFTEWNAYDEQSGYFTNNLLARIVIDSDDLSDADQQLATEYAIDEIVKENALGIHVKVYENEIVVPRVV